MSLNIEKLENVVRRDDGSIVAQCPACAADEHDQTGRNHLFINPDGQYGCAANAGDKKHRKRIFKLVGDKGPRCFTIRPFKQVERFQPYSILRKLETLAGTLGTGKSESVKHLGFDIPDFGTLGTGVFIPQSGFNFNEERRKKPYIGTKLPVPSVPSVPNSTKVKMDTTKFEHLAGVGTLDEVSKALKTVSGPVALDIETYGNGLNPWRGEIRLLSLAIPGHPAWLLDLQSIGYDLGELGQCLQERQIIAHNAKFDLLWLRHKCALKLDNVFCTLTAARLLSNGKRELRNGLYACWERFLGLAPGNDHGKSDWGGMFLTEDQLEYAALDVFHLHELQEKQQLLINKEKLGDVLHLENRLIPVVVEMENRGFGINKERLLGVIEEYSAELDEALGHFKEAFGEEINPNSPKQLKEAFKEKDLKLSDTGEQTLKEEDHPLTTCVLNYRSAKKQMEQAEALLKAIEEDGRIHARFEPTGTNTGRFSSKRPNLQNIGRGKLRHCFVPDEGNLLVVADYSQVELRVAAVVANEERMIEAYKNGVDLHRQTASLVLDKPIKDVTKEDRQLAKAVNFGLLYGQSAKGLVAYAKKAYGVEMEYDRAREIHGRFFSAYNGLRKWHERSREAASKDLKSVRTVSGRVRWLPEGKDTEWIRFVGLLNTSVQGGSADALKQAMVNLADKLPSSASIVSTVHDELIVECASDAAEEIKALVETAMLDAVQTMFPGVRFEVEAGICDSWAEK